MSVPRSHGFQDRRQSLAVIHSDPRDRNDLVAIRWLAGGRVEHLADREQADHDHDRIHSVEQIRNAKRESRVAGQAIDADEPEDEAEEEAGQPSHERAPQRRGDGGERHDRQREILGGSEAERQRDEERRGDRQRRGADRSGDERTNGGSRERGAAAARSWPSCVLRSPTSIEPLSPGVFSRIAVVDPPYIAP